MPINMSISIRSAVGAGSRAVNSSADVKAVQNQLNGHMGPGRTKLKVDGKIGPNTIGTIRQFQTAVCGMRSPDGRVDPRGKTETALNNPGSAAKFKNMSTPAQNMTPGVPVPGAPAKPGSSSAAALPASASPQEKQGYENIKAAIAQTPAGNPAQEVLDVLVKDYFTIAKPIIAAGAITSDATKIAQGFKGLRAMGMSAKEAAELSTHFLKYQRVGVFIKFMDDLGAGGSRMAKNLKALGKGAIILTVVITAFEVADHWNKARYGAAAGEIYKLGMSIAIPWAGLLDAVQTVLWTIMPSAKGNRFVEGMFMMLKAINPIAAWSTAWKKARSRFSPKSARAWATGFTTRSWPTSPPSPARL